MKKIKFFGIMMTLVFAVRSSSPVLAQENNWRTIFNGKDLSGWFEPGGINGKHKWEAKNGMIVGSSIPGQANGFLCTEKEYGDFVLELEVSIDTLMNNSGIQFRSLSYPDYNNSRLHGYQMEVEPLKLHRSGAIYDEGGTRGWLTSADQLSPAAQKAFKKDIKNGYVWNKCRIECIGSRIRTWVNGVPAAHLIDNKCLSGYIGLQMHANNPTDPQGSFSIRFRNIRVQTGDLKLLPLDNAYVVNLLPNNLSAQEEKNGYSLLWDGRSVKGWNGPNRSQFPANAWSVRDGELSALKSGDGLYIISEKQYGPFELKFDFKLSEGSNSSVKYFANESGGNTSAAISSLGFQIVDDGASGVMGSRTTGSLSDIMARPAANGAPGVIAGETTAARSAGGARPGRLGVWNQALIKMFPDNHVEYWLNGTKILEYQRGSAGYKDLVSKSKYKDIPNFGMSPKGHILLENNGSAVSYRSIKIRELK